MSSVIFCFKQNTAYELRISDWSSDVCSSDLRGTEAGPRRSSCAAAAPRTARRAGRRGRRSPAPTSSGSPASRSEEHTSELQSLMRISYAVFCLKKKKNYEQKPLSSKIL